MSSAGELVDQLRNLAVADLSDAATRLGLPDRVLNRSVRPISGPRFIGPALTLARVAPQSAVPQSSPDDPERYALHRLIEAATPGAVLVVGHDGDAERAFWGASMTALALAKGIVGLVTDGAVRDLADLRALDFAVHAQKVTPRGGGNRHYRLRAINGQVMCGGIEIAPGDIIVGDADGCIALSSHHAIAIAHEVMRSRRQ